MGVWQRRDSVVNWWVDLTWGTLDIIPDTGFPESVCAKPCGAGEFYIQGELPCCWECSRCRDNEYVTENGTSCEVCDILTWPDNISYTSCLQVLLFEIYQTIFLNAVPLGGFPSPRWGVYLYVIGILHRYSTRVGYGHRASRIWILFVCVIYADSSYLCNLVPLHMGAGERLDMLEYCFNICNISWSPQFTETIVHKWKKKCTNNYAQGKT